MTLRTTAWLIPLAIALVNADAAHAQAPIGRVTSLTGSVRAVGPGGARPLACGDRVYAGDKVSTGLQSSAGILLGDVLARVDAASELRVGQTAEGAPDATLERGRVRMIDAREGGAPSGRLVARTTEVQVAGNDAEAYLLAEKIGPYVMLCEWDEPVLVSRGAESTTMAPNQCVIAKDAESLYVANAHDERIPAAGGAPCPPDLGALAAPLSHFAPTDVAAGPPLEPWSSPALPVAGPERQACDQPGSGCEAPPGGIIIVEPPPDLGGGAPTFPGTN